ncbi:hypothetical protein QWT69_07540 [Sporosarcina oncorhynchi]|uniref:Uncharacterized protein n=1 Tax=Sporosarcina oncorhynchi TaxID=3056444 RepID=A0ABZ0LB38_9BACL|nr:hypothetical protein [Sporosarcina sp. T2O-4]WOV88947.1 hypothetical protein QWT69_07540 [Sporosarcina sp. T2O-4]
MKQTKYGLALLLFLAIPIVAQLLESIMIMHMHMQMPLLIISGFLIAPFFQWKYPQFFAEWNKNGIPGMLLFTVIMLYWMIPRTMDDALTKLPVEVFKFISLPFLAGLPLRDSWSKIANNGKRITFIVFTTLFYVMGFLYIKAPVQLCNNYLLIDQLTLGWGYLTLAICFSIYLVYIAFIDSAKPAEVD